jgi:NitT/TauT family transport system ATP-binding protein
VEAAKLMDFLVIQEGDLILTPVNIQFIAGGIDQRKQIVRTQILTNIFLVEQIFRMLQVKRNHRISEQLTSLDILETHFSPQEAMRQLKTAIDWGRYAELYSYDEPGGEIFL